jgi:hypothetical protein
MVSSERHQWMDQKYLQQARDATGDEFGHLDTEMLRLDTMTIGHSVRLGYIMTLRERWAAMRRRIHHGQSFDPVYQGTTLLHELTLRHRPYAHLLINRITNLM